MSKLQIRHLKNLLFVLTQTNSHALLHDVAILRQFSRKNSTCVFDFQRKIMIALLIEFIFYASNAYCLLKIQSKEV